MRKAVFVGHSCHGERRFREFHSPLLSFSSPRVAGMIFAATKLPARVLCRNAGASINKSQNSNVKHIFVIPILFMSFQLLTADTDLSVQIPVPVDSLKTLSYEHNVAPIVKTYCFSCHSSDDDNPSELYMDSYESLTKGGKHGTTFVAGNPDSSLLYLKLLPEPPFGKQMPRGHKRITPEAIQIIHDWIQQGARKQ